MDVLDRWQELVRRPEPEIPLDEAALLISAASSPTLDVDGELSRLDSIAALVRRPALDALCRLLFEDLGLTGDRESYGDPRNSYLDQVLRRRRGIPISLSVLLMEVGRRCGVTLEGVGMPGHFLVRESGATDVYVDAFDRGRRLDTEGCERLFRNVTGAGMALSPGMLAPSDRRAILARMLANLDRSFEDRSDRVSLAWVSELRARLPGRTPGDQTQLAGRLVQLGRFDRAADVLEEAAAQASASGDGSSERLLARAATLRARLN